MSTLSVRSSFCTILATDSTLGEVESVVTKAFAGLVPKRYSFVIRHFDGYKQQDGDSCGVLMSVFFEQYIPTATNSAN